MVSEEQKKAFDDVVEALAACDLLKAVVIIGSWAEYLYDVCGLYDGFQCGTYTRDVDILWKNLNRPSEKCNFVDILKDKGFEFVFSQVTGTVRLFKIDVIEVELLIAAKGSGGETFMKIPSIDLEANALRHLSLYTKFNFSVAYNGVHVNVATPESMVIQKLTINKERMEDKRMKDIAAINRVFEICDHEKLKNALYFMTKNERKTIVETAKENGQVDILDAVGVEF